MTKDVIARTRRSAREGVFKDSSNCSAEKDSSQILMDPVLQYKLNPWFDYVFRFNSYD